MKKLKYKLRVLLAFLVVAFIAFGFLGDDRNGIKKPRPFYKSSEVQQSGKQGDAYAIEVNNIYMPLNRKGIIADVNVPPPQGRGSLGQFAGHGFLFSSGFFISGFSGATMWAAAAASASLVEDFVQGTVAGGQNDPNAVLYVVRTEDPPYNPDGSASPSWSDWSDAVALGADFYNGDGSVDVNGNPTYTPGDLNGNGEWDKESSPGAGDGEDRPDMIGDITVWCVYHDGLPVAQRRWNTTIEVGLEIRQSVFAFASAGAIGNLIFVRYRFRYVGLGDPNEPNDLTDVYFGVWADPDVGNADDDLVGSDVPRNAGFTYNNGPDDLYGNTPPCFMIDFFQGPLVYIPGETFIDNGGIEGEYDEGIDTPLDTAYSVRGQIKGVVEYPGATNLPISSFVEYRNGDPILNDPSNKNEARNYILGLQKDGTAPDPCTFPYGEVRGGVLCDTINNKFWLSGDPVTDFGWINTVEIDQRQMTNTGPFVLSKNEEKEIVVAYVVNNGADAIDAITQTRKIDDGAQNIFDLNFLAPSPPPAPRVTLTSSDDFIDIVWPTPNQVTYSNQTPTWDLKFEGYRVWAFVTDNTQDFIDGQQNSKLIATYDLDNFIQDVYKENAETRGIELLYPAAEGDNSLDYDLYADAETGLIRLRIFNDPFDANSQVTKGRPYFFAVTSYALNYDALVYYGPGNFGEDGNYYLSADAFAQEAENPKSIRSIIVGENILAPPLPVQSAERISGFSGGLIQYDPVDNQALTGDTYEVTFFKDESKEKYSMFWKLENINNSTILLDSMDQFLFGSNTISYPSVEGFILKVSDETPALGQIGFETTDLWYDTAGTKFYYLNVDIEDGGPLASIGGQIANDTSKITTADKIRRVELRFGENGKAYRYLQGYVGLNPPTRNNSYVYAGGVTSDNPDVVIDLSDIGLVGEGFVDVPFTAWMVDENYDIDKQLAVGFLERRSGSPLNGTPDGVWDPGTDVGLSGEFIFVFDSDYDPQGNQQVYQGNYASSQTVWASLRGYDIPEDAVATEEERNIAKSPYFNIMYAVGVQKLDNEIFFQPNDKIIIPVGTYPYTDNDVFQFTTKRAGALSADEERNLWDKVNVYPNPLYGFNTLTSYTTGGYPDEPFVTFTNLPEEVTIKIYSLSGSLLRTLTTEEDKSSPTSPFIRWNLQNESSIRVASGMYLAIVSSPRFGDKVLKFAIIMPQKQIQRY